MLLSAVNDGIVPDDIVLGDAAGSVASAYRKTHILVVIDQHVVLGDDA